MFSFSKKNLFVSLIFVSAGFAVAGSAFAQRALEVPLPSIGGITISSTTLLPQYIKYIFNLAVGIAGLVAFLSLIYGGIRHITSGGNPASMQDANDQIFSAIIGLVVILGSWILLTTINPQLVNLSISREATPEAMGAAGVYLCKTSGDVTADNCQGPVTVSCRLHP